MARASMVKGPSFESRRLELRRSTARASTIEGPSIDCRRPEGEWAGGGMGCVVAGGLQEVGDNTMVHLRGGGRRTRELESRRFGIPPPIHPPTESRRFGDPPYGQSEISPPRSVEDSETRRLEDSKSQRLGVPRWGVERKLGLYFSHRSVGF